MVEYQYVMVLETIDNPCCGSKYSEKRTIPHSLIGCSVYEIVIVNKKLASWNATIQNTAKRISA